MTNSYSPLADQLRPNKLKDLVGQKHLIGTDRPLYKLIISDHIPSMIFWGPPGTGKTTLARIIANSTQAEFIELSAIEGGVSQIKEAVLKAKENQKYGRKTILFIDEIHRYNKSQQATFLPYVESGIITLIGATTENPSFEVISPLLSRSRVFVFKELSKEELTQLIKLGAKQLNVKVDAKAKDILLSAAGGDARAMLNLLEMSAASVENRIVNADAIKIALEHEAGKYDKKGENHFNTISAFIKCLRASDPDAALYYLSKMVISGEDPKFIARRMVIFASEDIGNADPHALTLAVSCFEAVERIGYPECTLNLAQVVIYLAMAPKSRACCEAINNAMQVASQHKDAVVPMHLRNAVTDLMKEAGYGRREADEPLSNMPTGLSNRQFYKPNESGKEKLFIDRLHELRRKNGYNIK